MEKLRFDDIVRDLVVDDARRAADLAAIAPADRTYVILFSARSGSSWLTSVLSATGCLGLPEEYINPNHVLHSARTLNARTAPDLLAMLQRRRRTANGVFGLEARQVDVELLGRDAFVAAFGADTLFFHLWRDNIVLQAISLWRATVTGYFHSISTQAPAPLPAYDAARIRGWIDHLVATENGNIALLHHIGRAVRPLRYEDMVADRAGTVGTFARALGVALPPVADAPSDLRKIGDDWNTDMEARFRADCAGELAELEADRRIRDVIPPLDPAAGAPDWRSGYAAGLQGDVPRRSATAAWHDGWRDGWRRAPAITPAAPGGLAEPARPQVADEPAAKLIARVLHDLPGPLHDHAAAMTLALLRDQDRRGTAGTLLDVGPRPGRQAALLVHTAQRGHGQMLGIDTGTGPAPPGIQLTRHFAPDPAVWSVRRVAAAELSPAALRSHVAAPARYIGLALDLPADALPPLLAACAELLHADGIVCVADYLHPLALPITDGVHRYLAGAPALVPFGYLVRRLLLAPAARAAGWRQTLYRAACAEQDVKPIGPIAELLSRGDAGRLERALCGHTVLVLG